MSNEEDDFSFLTPKPMTWFSKDLYGKALEKLFQKSVERSVDQSNQVSFSPLSSSKVPSNLRSFNVLTMKIISWITRGHWKPMDCSQ